MTATSSMIRQLVEHYHQLGLVALPVEGKRPVSLALDDRGRPLRREDGRPIRWQPFVGRFPAEVELDSFEWGRATGLALVLGPATWQEWPYLWCLDIESEHREAAEHWLDVHLPAWRDGVVIETGSVGLHVYFLASRPVATHPTPWGEVRGKGSICVLPPSRHPETGRPYRWLSERWTNLPTLEPEQIPGYPVQGRSDGQAHEPLDVPSALAGVPLGQRNTTLFRLACKLRGLGLPQDWALELVSEAAANCTPPWGSAPDEEPVEQLVSRVYRTYQPNPELIVSNGHRQSPVTGLSDSDSDDAVRPVAVWELPEPAPREWLLADLLPADTTTLWYGDDGSGKSLLALALSVAVAAGLPFLGRPVQRGPVLYVDTEFAADEFQRRAYQLARGMGLGRPPEGLWYVRTRYSLSSPGGQRDLARLVEQLQPVLVVVDSLTLGTWTDDLKEAQAAVAVLQFLESLGTTVLALDHIPKNLAQNQAYARPWGSFSKRAKARHAVLITQADAGGVLLRVTKSNVARLGAMVGCSLTFAGDRIVLEPVALGSDDLAGIDQHLPPLEQVYQALVRLGTAGPDTLAAETGLAVGTVKNKLTALRRQGRAEPLGDGRWRTTQPASLVTRSKDSDRDDDPGSGPSPSSLVTHYSDSDSDDDPGKPNISHHDAKIGGHDLAGKTEHGPGKPNISDNDAKNGGQSPAAKTEHDPGKPNISDADAKTAICEQCGNPFAWSGRGKPARYCSDACRMKATRQRQYPQTGQLVNALTDGGGPMENLADVLIATGDRTGWPLSAARLAELTGVPWDETQPVLQALLDGGTLVSLHGDRRVMTHTVLARPGCRGWTLIARTLEGDDGQ